MDDEKRNLLFFEPRCGHCLTGDTPIITEENGEYRIKELKNLDNHDGTVLSYNFSSKEFEFQPILNFMEQGKKEVFEVKVSKGETIKCTKDHRFFNVVGPRKDHRYIETKKLENFKIDSPYWRNLAVSRQIPSLEKKGNPNLLWLEGLFVGDGYYGGQKTDRHVYICNSNPEILDKARRILSDHDIGYREEVVDSGTTKIFVHKSELRKILKKMGRSSSDKRFLNNRLSLGEKELSSLLDGFAKADAYKNPSGNMKLIYGTSSDKLVRQVKLMHLILGRPVGSYYQENHQGVGNQPIWRIYENPNSYFNYTMEGLGDKISKVGIKSIEGIGREKTYDIEVANTHNFVLADSGVIAHNCEDVLDATSFMDAMPSIDERIDVININDGFPENRTLQKVKEETETPGAHGTPTRVKDGVAKLGSLGFDSELGWEEGIHDLNIYEDIVSL